MAREIQTYGLFPAGCEVYPVRNFGQSLFLHFPSTLPTGWDKEIDINKTIQLVRAQRYGMVHSEVKVMINFCAFLSQILL